MPTFTHFARRARRTIALATFFALMCQFSVGVIPTALAADPTIVEWNFPNDPDDATADGGISANSAKTISTVDANAATFAVSGATTNSASATGWDSGSGTKYWQIEFETTGYESLSLSSAQKSSGTGPADFAIEYSLDGSTWTSLATVTNTDDWATTSPVNLSACDEENSVQIRWIMTSNTSVGGGAVGSTGTSRIDDIVVTGVAVATVDPSNVFVDDDCDTSPVGTEADPLCTIRGALAVVAPGGTINVAAGNYSEAGQITIDKNLTITGADKTTTIVKPNHDTNTSTYEADSGWFYVPSGVSATIKNLTLDGAGKTINTAIQSRGNVIVEDCLIKNIRSADYIGFGVQFLSGANNAVTRCEFENIERVGIHVRGGKSGTTEPIATITDCTYTGKGAGLYLDYGIEFGGGGTGTVDNFTVSGNVGVAYDGSTSAGILATDYFGPGTSATVVDSHFSNNYAGISVGYITAKKPVDLTEVTATGNVFDGNTNFGIQNVGTVAVDAKNNYWGSAMGPASCSDGDQVSANVDYSPWYTDDTLMTTRNYNVRNTTASSNYSCIQSAIDAATAGDTIEVAAGTFVERVDVDKGINLKCAGRDKTLIKGNSFIRGDGATIDACHIQATTATTHGIQIYPASGAKDVTIKNSKIESSFVGKAAIYVDAYSAPLDGFTLEKNIIIGDYGVTQSFGALNTLIKGNTFEGITGSTNRGIQIKTSMENVTIKNNEISGFAKGIKLDNNLTALGAGPVIIKGNNIHDNSEEEIYVNRAPNVEITENTIKDSTGAEYNIFIGNVADNDVNFIRNNKIFGPKGIKNIGSNTVDAEYNYWGSADEPVAKVSGNVDYDPWLTGDPDDVANIYESSSAGTSFSDPVAGISSITLTPAGDLSIVEYNHAPTGDAAMSGFAFAGSYFDINSDLTNGSFTATIVFEYSEDPGDPGKVNGVPEEDLRVTYFDPASGKWKMIPGTLDTVANTYTFTTTHFTAFTLVGTQMDIDATDNFAPVTAQSGTSDLGILELVFTNSTGSADTLTDLTVTSKNTADGDVVQVELFTGSVGGTSIGTATFSGGTATFSGLTQNIPTGTSSVFVAFDLASGPLTGGNVLDASIPTNGVTLTNSGTNIAALDPAGATTIDDAAPTVALTDDDSDYFWANSDASNKTYDGLVRAGESVTFTATFNEVMTNSPTISITSPCSPVSNVAMTDAGAGTIWNYSWSVPTCGAASDATPMITVAGTDLAGNAYSGTEQLRFIYDNTPPTLATIKNTDTGPVQSDTIQIKVTEWIGLASSQFGFSADATCDSGDTYSTSFASETDFDISGDHTDYLCARAVDDAGHTTFSLVGQLNTDNTAPVIASGVVDGTNNFITVNFTETNGIYSNNNGTGDLTAADFRIIFTQNSGTATDATIAGVVHTAPGTSAQINLTITGTPNGAETIEILPADGASIFDLAGNAMSASATTGAENLNDKFSPTLVSVDWNDLDADTAISGGDEFVLTFSEAMNTATIAAGALDTDLGLDNSHSFGTTPVLAWTSGNTVLTITSDSDSTVAHADTLDPANSVLDAAGNVDATNPAVSILDDVAPNLTETTAVTTPTSDSTPNYVFNSSEAGALAVGGSCDSANHAAVVGGNTIAFSSSHTAQVALPDGIYSDCTIVVTDAAGNASASLAVTAFTVDTDAPTLDPVSIASDNSNSALAKVGDLVTISFTADEPIQNVVVTIDGNSADSITNTSGNNWTATRTMQSGDTDGVIPFTVDFDDLAGNSGTQITATSDSSAVTFDEIDPTATAFTPADGATGVAVDTDFTITFSENMRAGTGNILVKKSSDDSTVVSIPAGDAQISFAGNVATINPTADLSDSTSYYFAIPSGAFTDLAGNPFAAITDKSAWNFMTVFGANGGNIITLEKGWNVFSTPRELDTIEFFNGGTDIYFYKLEGGTYASTTTATTVANIKPLEGFLVNNTSGSAVDVYLDYADDITGQGGKVFNKDLVAGWNLIGIANKLLLANDVDYTEIPVSTAFFDISNTGSLIDYTDNFSDDNNNAVDSFTQIDSNNPFAASFEEFKAYLVFIHQGGTKYGGNQDDN